MSDSPITLGWDEDGLHITVDVREMETLTGEELGTPYAWPETLRGKLSTSGALDLYEHVQRELGEWYREGVAARSAVAAGVTLAEYVGADDPDDGLDPLDPKSPRYAESLRDLGDISRKTGRENQP